MHTEKLFAIDLQIIAQGVPSEDYENW